MLKEFVIDQWNCDSQAYFLTHLHADHTSGLSAKWCRGPLYCSQITAILLLAKFKGFDTSLVHVLHVGTPRLIELRQRVLLEVTAIDADHCPGALMYVFHGKFGTVIHTGDFRWNNDDGMLNERKSQIQKALAGSQLDFVYIDNTFCNPLFDFPSRPDAAKQMIDIIRRYPKHDIVIGIDNLGKENLLLCIADAFETKVCAWPERLTILRLLNLGDVFTSDTTTTRFRAALRYSITVKNLRMMNQFRPTIAIIPTGCYSSVTGSEHYQTSQPMSIADGLIHIVPYSLHCCFSELEAFVEFVRPTTLMGIVKSHPHLNICPAQQLHHHQHHQHLIRTSDYRQVSEWEKDEYTPQLEKLPNVNINETLNRLKSSKRSRMTNGRYYRWRKLLRLKGKGAKLSFSQDEDD